MKFLLMTFVAAAFAAVLAGAASSRVESGVDGAGSSQRGKASPVVASTETEADDANEATGTATSDGTSITVTRTDGSTVTCAVPAGVDLTPFLTGKVKAECEDKNGVLTLRELESETGQKVEIEDDGTVETELDDEVNSGPGNAEDDEADDNSGPGNAEDDEGEVDDDQGEVDDDHGEGDDDQDNDAEDDDHSGPGGGDDDD